jgi:SAM-dependent methyltransferase
MQRAIADRRQSVFHCPRCSARTGWVHDTPLVCTSCGYAPLGEGRYVDLLGDGASNKTDEHYTYQWGKEKGFYRFFRKNAAARNIMPAGQLGWPALFEHVRTEASAPRRGPICVYDAACGFGGIASELVTDATANGLQYVGADIHHSLPDLLAEQPLLNDCGLLLRWDIGKPLPLDDKFDYVLCRAAIHHTPDPQTTFRALVQAVKPGGRIAISAYRKKGPAREALDDRFRQMIASMPVKDAYQLCRQFTLLGMYLQQVDEQVTIEEDLELFGIRSGTYPVQTLFYNHFMKCFFNPAFGEDYSTLVNFDWYHPTHAYRYELADLLAWFNAAGIHVVETQSIEAQYYLLGEKAA